MGFFAKKRNDYYPFGQLLPNRSGSSDGYRYGFGGQEKDNEVKGNGNSYDYGNRFHDPRVGRWLSLDAVSKAYQGNYNFASNSPIMFVDEGGDDDYYYDRTTNSVYVIRTGAPHRFIFTEYIFSDPVGDSQMQIGEPVNMLYPVGSKKVQELFYRHNNVFQDALYHARGADHERIYNSYNNLGNAEAGKVIAVVAAAPAVLVVGLEVLAAYGTETVLTYIANEAKDEVLSQATGGASDVLDVSKTAKNLVELGVKKLVKKSDGVVLKPDFVVTPNGTAVSTDLKKIEKSFDDAGFEKIEVNPKNSVYEVPKGDGSRNNMYIRLQEGNTPRTSDFDGDRVITTNATGNTRNKDYVNPDGSRITGQADKAARREKGHVHLEKPKE